jgi:hypothetical protein
MKRKITLLFIIALVVGGMVGFANDGNGDMERRHNRCNPAGTWYAELGSPPYIGTITPIQGHSRYSVVFKGVYDASDLGLVRMTNWSGEFVKSGDGYNAAAIAILGGGEGMPHWFPLETWGVKGYIEFSEDCNTMYATWPGGVDAWIWDTETFPFVPPPIPWVTTVDYHPLTPDPSGGPTPIYETYHRMIMPTD